MTTFDGQVREYPVIAIDRFKSQTGVKYYFLTHAHADHTQGLENSQFRGKLHCTEITAKLLLNKRIRKKQPFAYLHSSLITHVEMEEFILETTEYGRLTITFLPANHCPGAIMILIQGCNGTVLHTGDMRAEPAFVDDSLSVLETLKIRHLYMDTTFCAQQFDNFITKDKAIELLIDLVQKSPKDQQFYFDFWMYGHEELWFAIAHTFDSKIHVSPERYHLYCSAHSSYNEVLTLDSNVRFHSCRWQSPCCQLSNKTICIYPKPTTDPGMRLYENEEYLLRTDLPRNAQLDQYLVLPFSMHSSLSEIVGFIKYVRPSRLTATVAHGKWNQVEYMRNLLSLHGADVFSSGNQSSSSNNDSSSISLLIESADDESNTTQDTYLFSDENDPVPEPPTKSQPTKYDRAAAKFRERYSKRKTIHVSTLETLTWHGSSIEELAVPTKNDGIKEQQQQQPKDNDTSRESLQSVSGNNKKAKIEQHQSAKTPIVICLD
ncbi:protein artemis [Lichtheimia corymbifera JMRC:FSU:9682]|uniref:Protein artemis n=1 Tax=Lichtheimia corymbifera JMRC:FSU:9682 TaxID=1263082 RepID=A0A068RLN0_9FUNG|nr:protein artemis [Lichtheimia corymbifera JMRC:FSU:9682]